MAKERQAAKDHPRRRPAYTAEARENQMIAMAVDLAEQQLRDGTASAQVITHYLKLGSSKERIEKEVLELKKELISARTEGIRSQRRIDELYGEAIAAMREYSGQGRSDED